MFKERVIRGIISFLFNWFAQSQGRRKLGKTGGAPLIREFAMGASGGFPKSLDSQIAGEKEGNESGWDVNKERKM